MRVAILGATGIGKNHAAWFTGHGCDVVSFLGSTRASIQATTALLQGKICFTGKGYQSLQDLLEFSRPDIVCVSTPPVLHDDHVRQSLLAGAHVLCEKPLVGDDVQVGARPWQNIVAEGDALVKLADKAGRLFGTQMQYGHAAGILVELVSEVSKPLLDWSMEFETRTVRPGRSGAQIWIDLSPHPLSILQKYAGRVEIDWASAQCRVENMETEASFHLRIAGQEEPCRVRISTRCNPNRETPLRRTTMNGIAIDYSARRNDAGDFKSFFQCGEVLTECPDLCDLLIGNFVRACRGEETLLVTGEDGARNVEMQLRLLECR